MPPSLPNLGALRLSAGPRQRLRATPTAAPAGKTGRDDPDQWRRMLVTSSDPRTLLREFADALRRHYYNDPWIEDLTDDDEEGMPVFRDHYAAIVSFDDRMDAWEAAHPDADAVAVATRVRDLALGRGRVARHEASEEWLASHEVPCRPWPEGRDGPLLPREGAPAPAPCAPPPAVAPPPPPARVEPDVPTPEPPPPWRRPPPRARSGRSDEVLSEPQHRGRRGARLHDWEEGDDAWANRDRMRAALDEAEEMERRAMDRVAQQGRPMSKRKAAELDWDD